MPRYILFIVVIFLSHIIQGITGFAGTVLAVPFGIFLVGLGTSIAVMNVVGIIAGVYICLVAHQHIRWPVVKRTLAIMIPGLVAGFFLSRYLADYGKIQQLILGLFVFAVGGINLVKKRLGLKLSGGEAALSVLLFLGGIFHGMYVCGGALLVVYLSNKLNKDEFRANISVMWLALNSLVMVSHIHNGYLDRTALALTAVAAPIMLVSVHIGGLLLARMSQEFFVKLTNVLLMLSGLVLTVNSAVACL